MSPPPEIPPCIFQERGSKLILLLTEELEKATYVTDEKNERLLYPVVGKKAVGVIYSIVDESIAAKYRSEIAALIRVAQKSPSDNELAPYLWWAQFHRLVWEMQNEGDYEDAEIEKLNADYIIKLPPDMVEEKSDGQPPPPRDLEDAGIVGFYDHIRADQRYTVIFENTLGYEIRGLDVILRDEQTKKLIFVELKGTSRKIRGPLSYLKRTKTKGRQLSWEWVFRSLLNVHHAMAASSVLLYCLEPIFSGEAERWLAVTRATRVESHWENQEIKVFKESDRDYFQKLDEGYSFQRYKDSYFSLKEQRLVSF